MSSIATSMSGCKLMKFEESWYLLNLIGFRKLEGSWFHGHRTRKHQESSEVKRNVETLFSDEHVYKPLGLFGEDTENEKRLWLGTMNYHEPIKPYRDRRIEIKGPKKCARCGSIENLEREHIVPLHVGGADESNNLQWMCAKCHDFKHAEEKILAELEYKKKGTWRYEMWEYRLNALRRLNPTEAEKFHSYGEDPKTLWSYWSKILEKRARAIERARSDRFFERVDEEENQIREEHIQARLLPYVEAFTLRE